MLKKLKKINETPSPPLEKKNNGRAKSNNNNNNDNNNNSINVEVVSGKKEIIESVVLQQEQIQEQPQQHASGAPMDLTNIPNENMAGKENPPNNLSSKQMKSSIKREKLKILFNDEAVGNNENNASAQCEKTTKVVRGSRPNFVAQKNKEVLVTDALRKLTKKTVTTTKDKQPSSNAPPSDGTPSAVTAQGSVIIDKQVSVSGPFKKVKCVYTILNNDQINALRRHAQDAVKQNHIFTIRGNYNSVRHALKSRGWVEKLEYHRKSGPLPTNQISICDLSQVLPKRKTGETQRQFVAKVERNIMSRYIEHVPCDLLWTPHKEKSDYVDQSRNPNMLINKFNRAPFTNKENLNAFLRDMPAFYEEGVAESRFPRCFNVWSPEELNEFIEHFKLTACISFIRWLVDKYHHGGFDAVFSPSGKVPYSCIDFAFKRCMEFFDSCLHNDLDVEDPPRIWEHDWDAFLHQHYQLTHEHFKILADPQRIVENIIVKGGQILEWLQPHCPQFAIDGYQNLWIIKPANKCRGRGILLSNNLKKIINIVNPSIATKSRFVVQKYMERPLIIHQTKFDIRQWFLISSIHPLMIWMYKECYLRFSSQEYTLNNHHESVHLTNHAIQKKYTNNGKRDKRLPNENMWDSYSFQAYLRQIGKQDFWLERIYPGMRKAIVAAILVSQDHMERTPNTFELFGADFMICENFYPWLIEINSNPDLGATTSVTARMCPQCLEDVVKVVIDRRNDFKADVGNFELVYRQVVPPTPAYMGLNLIVKGKQISNRSNGHHHYGFQRKERTLQTSHLYKQRTSLALTQTHKPMPAFNATEYVEKCLNAELTNSPRSKSVPSLIGLTEKKSLLTTPLTPDKRRKSMANAATAAVGRTATNTTGHSNASTICDVYSTLKRHRSCGPRLNTHCGAVDCKDTQKYKFFVGSYNQQKAINSTRSLKRVKTSNLLDTPLLSVSKSADNIKELCSPGKSALQATKSLSPMIIIPSRSASHTSKAQTNAANSKHQSDKQPKYDSSAHTIHAIGKGITSWNTRKRPSGSKPLPAKSLA